MQTLNCTVGHWRAKAQIQEVESGKLMAVIRVTDERGTIPGESRHTVVFEHKDGNDTLEETRSMVQHLLHARYGSD
jgi:hypothetical protein